MTASEPQRHIERLLGKPDVTGKSARAELDAARCAELLALVRAAAPDARLRREPWERRNTGETVSLGNDFSLVLGLDFPSGELHGPDGAWVRSQRPAGASHWRLMRREAARLWLLLVAHEQSSGWRMNCPPAD